MNIGPSQYATTKSETHTAVLDWIQVTEEFHRYHSRINKILKDKEFTHCTDSPASKSHRVSRLDTLRQHMSDVLETLLSDISRSPEVPYNNGLRANRLATHARLLREMNKKIARELSLFAAFQA